jgi:hypothetical protein
MLAYEFFNVIASFICDLFCVVGLKLFEVQLLESFPVLMFVVYVVFVQKLHFCICKGFCVFIESVFFLLFFCMWVIYLFGLVILVCLFGDRCVGGHIMIPQDACSRGNKDHTINV